MGFKYEFYHFIEQMFLTFRSDQSLSRVRLFATPWIAAHQATLSITNSRSSLRLMSIESAKPSSHLILCRPLLLLSPIPPSIRIFSNGNIERLFFSGLQNHCRWYCSHEIKRCFLLGRKPMTNPDSLLKSRDITLPTKVQSYGFPSSHVWMWELDHK